ncbi:MAG: serine--tRNA ligase [Bacteroidia bacterium]|nr:serine--tRNA ligase [Bacteroidia bacterium]NNC84598.1 serine--tRNA ligase [Bacteroidia bacterium]NNM16042.1 serine--tRNA ligase [Bacteroidia bacterium]
MLQISKIRENTEELLTRLKVKNFDGTALFKEVIELDKARRSNQQEMDSQLAEQNKIAKQVGELFKSGKQDEAKDLKEKAAALKESSKGLENDLREIGKKIQDILLEVPNVPCTAVPAGNTPEENIIMYRSSEELPKMDKSAKPHWELIKQYDIIDFELGNKLTGAGFPVYKGKGARLQRALINYFLDKATAEGYREMQPPIVVNEDSGYGTGQLPDKEGQMYHMEKDNLYMIPTAEVPLTNIFRDVIVKEDELPIKITAYTPCFRREAGAWGADVRGLNRLHQFDKVEIVQVNHPDNSYDTIEKMKDYVAGLLDELELPYRILKLCGGDLSFASALTYDLEVYSAAQEKWLEVSSVSNFETFQANRMKLRYRSGSNKPELAHTLNGSALAFPRIVAALLENNQGPDGIKIPKALQPYTGFDMIN